MTAKIIPFTGITRLDLDADTALERLKGQLEGFVYAGYGPNGEEVFGSTYADGGTTLWLLERCRMRLMSVTEPEDGQ